MPQTIDEIRRQGLDALCKRLGRAGMIRFLQEFSSGEGDYAKERHAWVDALSMEDLQRLSRRHRETKPRRRRKS